MQIISIHLKNIKSHRDTELTFSPGINVLSGANGVGKSTIFESVGYALFGVDAQSFVGNVERFITIGAKRGEITVIFQLTDGEQYRVSRTVGTPSKWLLAKQIGGEFEVEEHKDSKETEVRLKELLGLNAGRSLAEQFELVIGPFQNEFLGPFVIKQATRRRDKFDEILGIDTWRKTFNETKLLASTIKAKIEVLDTGKPWQEASVVDVVSGADALEFFAGLAPAVEGNQQQVGEDFYYTRPEPLGVCAGIGAWNYPLQIACWKAAPALACGNAMIFKPSEETPLGALKLAEILFEAGLPAGVFNVIQGDGKVGAWLSHHEDIAKVSFTGEVGTGKKVMAAAAGTLHPAGLKVDNAIDMVKLMEPLAGRFAISIFVGGIVAAGLSSLFPIILLAPWLFADFNNKPRNMKSRSSRLLVLFGVVLGLVVPIFGGRPVLVMIMSQAMAAIVTPLVLALMLIIYNKKSVMGDNTLGVSSNISMGFILLFTIAMAVAGIIGIAGQFR